MTLGEEFVDDLDTAREMIDESPGDPHGYHEAGELLLLFGDILRARRPDDPSLAIACHERAGALLQQARGLETGAYGVVAIDHLIAINDLRLARLRQDAERWHSATAKLVDLLDAIGTLSDAPDAYVRALRSNCHRFLGHAYAGTMAGFPVGPNLGLARSNLGLAVETLEPHVTRGDIMLAGPLCMALLTWGMVEDLASNYDVARDKAAQAMSIADLADDAFLIRLSQLLYDGGAAAMDQGRQDAYASVPDDAYQSV